MATLAQLKLSKLLLTAMISNGYLSPTEIQSILFPRISGGQDLVAIGPDGCGKTTTCVLAALNKIKFTEEIAPRILYLVPDIETGEEVLDQFHTLNRNRDLRFLGLFAGGASLDTQVLELTDGVDVVVATPERARAAYLKLGLNLNKIQLFIVDDADIIIKKGLTLPTNELARSTRKAQFLVCSSVYHDRLEKMFETFIEIPNVIEVEDFGDEQLNTVEQLLYVVPNFSTKLYLLEMLMADKEVFEKVILFVNAKFTAETVYKKLSADFGDEIGVYRLEQISKNSFTHLDDFKLSPKGRILILVNEDAENLSVNDFPCILHFDLPEDEVVYTRRLLIEDNTQIDQLALTFATELELDVIKKLEQVQGKKMQRMELPKELFIVKNESKKERDF
ncbi:MAG: DEAD/DEAH box helicase [Sphingobacteriales bacterium]|nr:DEAD/DEAH box helicase [Sphingobacteriales bacterium]